MPRKLIIQSEYVETPELDPVFLALVRMPHGDVMLKVVDKNREPRAAGNLIRFRMTMDDELVCERESYVSKSLNVALDGERRIKMEDRA